MTNLISLTELEIAAVAGGLWQSISISASQSNTSSVTQAATATNTGAVTATASGDGSLAAAVGATAENVALVSQTNLIGASNSVRFGRH